MISRYVNQVLDRAERLGGWFPCLAGALLGWGVGWAVQGAGWAWGLLAAGLVLSAVRPAGTSLRRRLLIRQVRQQIKAFSQGGAR
jgi:hypothetical protein